MKNTKFTRLFFVLILLQSSSFLYGQPPFGSKVKRILFMGNSITYQGTYVVDIEAYMITHYPKQSFEFINVGLPSETVSGLSEDGHAGGRFPRPDLHERLARVLRATKPDLVFVCYGMNDGIYQPFDEGRFQKFKDGINWVHDEVIKTGASIVHVTPPVFDEQKGWAPKYATVLDKYSDWLISKKTAAGWEVADLHYPMKKYLEAHRKVDSTFKIAGFALAEDGIHLGQTGHWIMAKSILLDLGEKDAANTPDINAAVAIMPNGKQILKLVAQRQDIMKDAWLTSIGHLRPDMKVGLPLSEAQTKALEIETQIRALLK